MSYQNIYINETYMMEVVEYIYRLYKFNRGFLTLGDYMLATKMPHTWCVNKTKAERVGWHNLDCLIFLVDIDGHGIIDMGKDPVWLDSGLPFKADGAYRDTH